MEWMVVLRRSGAGGHFAGGGLLSSYGESAAMTITKEELHKSATTRNIDIKRLKQRYINYTPFILL